MEKAGYPEAVWTQGTPERDAYIPVCRLKRLEACDLSHVRFTNTFTGNGTAVCIDSLPGNEVLDFAGSTFSENEVDIDNKIGHPIDTAKAIFK